MQTTVEIKFKSQHGFEVMLPVCKTAQIFADIAGMKTLTKPVIEGIKALGYNIIVQQETRSV